jgi:hypothetical protein
MLTKTYLSLLCLTLLAGCASEAPESDAMPVADAQQSAELNGLADHEVTDFLTIVRDLPGGEFPEFEPDGIPSMLAGEEPEAAILVWRVAYRQSCDPRNLARSWAGDQEIQNVLNRRGYSPEQFADLVRRISLAVTAEALEDRMDFASAQREVEEQLLEMSQAIHQFDVVPDPSLTEQEQRTRREALMLALQDTTALSEFLKMLAEMPANAREVAQRRRADLAPHLPEEGTSVSQFERYFESDAQIVPAANWQPQN